MCCCNCNDDRPSFRFVGEDGRQVVFGSWRDDIEDHMYDVVSVGLQYSDYDAITFVVRKRKP